MKKSEAIFSVLRVPMDGLAVLTALLLAYRLREARIDLLPNIQLLEPATTLPTFSSYAMDFALPGVLLFLILASLIGLYRMDATVSAWREVGRVAVAAGLWLVLIVGWYFLIRKELFYSRLLLVHAVFFIAFFSLLGRMSLVLLERSFLRLGVGRRLVLSIGALQIAAVAANFLKDDLHYSYIGHVPNMDALRRVAGRHRLDLVLQTDPNPENAETLALIEYCRSHHVGYAYLPPVLADVPHLLRLERLGTVPLVRFQPTPLDGWGRVAKRLFDLVVSFVLLILLLPIFFAIAIAVLIDGGWPVLYASDRVGENGRRRILIFKFRSMVRNADILRRDLLPMNHRTDGPLFKMKNDPRVTRVGSFLRRWTLDELPQLWNVFRGRMSLVGPRPHLPDEVERYSPLERRVFAVKPGMTGLAQISGRSDLQFSEEVRLDLQYVEEWSLLLDLWILWRTLWVVVSRKAAD